VSSIIGSGMGEFFTAVGEKRQEYEREYKPELERRIRERIEEKKTGGLENLMKDMEVGSTSHRTILYEAC
jgi:GPN-loop GTPase